MRFNKPIPHKTIAALIKSEIIGNASANATGINEIHMVEPGDLVFVDHPRYYDKCLRSPASYIIINKRLEPPEGKALLIVDDPFEAYQKIVSHYRSFDPSMQM